ncbi:MAG: hypothetical protein OXG59_15495 [Gammaproteobacteria bacterium]|nr:hypothetical protein [Gammaproteobacteria bacterium]
MSKETESTASEEFAAIGAVYTALAPLSQAAQHRVVTYISSLLELGDSSDSSKSNRIPSVGESQSEPGTDDGSSDEKSFSTFADFYDAADPRTQADSALVAAVWLLDQGSEQFAALAINRELQNLGRRIGNITDALSSLQSKKPALVVQVKKAGRSRQARKTYKVTRPGIERVREMTGD